MNILALIKRTLVFLTISIFFASTVQSQNKTIAITIDDLPFVGDSRNFHLNMIIEVLKEHHTPATGFIIGQEVRPDSWTMLNKFRDSGFSLGNHTFSHINLNTTQTKAYIHDISAADKLLSKVMTEPKYFRYPYLAMGNGPKRNDILCYLQKKHYQIAPITIDSKDFFFNQRLLSVPEINRRHYLDIIKPFYLEFIWQQTLHAEEKTHSKQSQILLIHANLLNAYVLADIIRLYKSNGYTVVNLEEALQTVPKRFHCTAPKPKKEKPIPAPLVAKNDEFLAWD